MGKYKITFKKSVAKDLRSIPNADVARILKKIDALAENPKGEGGVKLSGHDCYRIRQGVYRIIYEIRELALIVQVIKVAHRGVVYKR